MEFTHNKSAYDTKVLHVSLDHHLEGPIQTGHMGQQESYEIQPGQIQTLVYGMENVLQLYRLRLNSWGVALLQRIWDLNRQSSAPWMHCPVLPGFGCQRWMCSRSDSRAELLWRTRCRKSQQGFSSPSLGSCFQPRLFSWLLPNLWPHLYCNPACACPWSLWTWPDGQSR